MSPEPSDVKANPGEVDGDDVYDAQPGISHTPAMPMPDDIPSIQAQMAQLMIMMQSPQIAPQVRMQLDMQFQELSMRLNQLQMQQQQFYPNMPGGSMIGIGPGIGMDMNLGMGMGNNMDGMLSSGYNNGNQSTGYQRFNQKPQNGALPN